MPASSSRAQSLQPAAMLRARQPLRSQKLQRRVGRAERGGARITMQGSDVRGSGTLLTGVLS
eukprot:3240208-Rhodomonas_salina.1